jgi:hypothetical protein
MEVLVIPDVGYFHSILFHTNSKSNSHSKWQESESELFLANDMFLAENHIGNMLHLRNEYDRCQW